MSICSALLLQIVSAVHPRDYQICALSVRMHLCTVPPPSLFSKIYSPTYFASWPARLLSRLYLRLGGRVCKARPGWFWEGLGVRGLVGQPHPCKRRYSLTCGWTWASAPGSCQFLARLSGQRPMSARLPLDRLCLLECLHARIFLPRVGYFMACFMCWVSK